MSSLKTWFHMLIVAAAAALAGEASAHSMWLAEKDGALQIQYGHENDLDPYKPERVGGIRAFAADGRELKPQVRSSGSIVSVDAGEAAMVSAAYDNKAWTKSASKGWVNLPRADVPDGSQSGLSQKFTKTYLKPARDFGKPLGQALELIPLSDPASLKTGDRLKVRVLLDGKPLAGVKVATNMFDYSDKAEKAVTDAEGAVVVTVPGRQMAGVEIEHFAKTAGNSEIDGIWYTASITFRVSGR